MSARGSGKRDDTRRLRGRSTSRLEAPASFSLERTVQSHGWFDLPPFHWKEDERALYRAIRTAGGPARALRLSQPRRRELLVELLRCGGPPLGAGERRDAARQAAHMLRLDEPFEEFHALCRSVPGYAWVPASRAGRLLRSPEPFEDLVKLLCTTNCTWALTKVMISALVEGLGEPVAGDSGELPEGARRAFPHPAAMAAVPLRFYSGRVRAGYRAPALRELARRVATGGIAPLSWLDPAADPDAIAAEILSVRGAGRYVAENMLKLLGRYDGLGLDSWCRRKFAEIHGRGRPVSDRTIARHYARFGRWRGLALWCDLTRDWCDGPGSGLDALRQGKY